MAATAARAHRPLVPPAAGSADAAVAVARVKQQFAGARDQQIDQLTTELLQTSNDLGTGCLVYGPPATGKTTVVRWAGRPLFLRPLHSYLLLTLNRHAQLPLLLLSSSGR